MEENENNSEPQRPQGLRVLCVLTFIFTSFMGLFALLGMIFSKALFQTIEQSYTMLESSPNMDEKTLKQIQVLLEMGSGKFILICGGYLLIVGMSFFGALQMWQMKYRGFIMYAIANGFMLVSNSLQINIFGALLDLLFIGLYYRQSKFLVR
jgi:hypothetical protein